MAYRSIPLSVKAVAVGLHLAGESKYNIAKQLKMSPNTVNTIIKKCNLGTVTDEVRAKVFLLAPKAIEVIGKKLDAESETSALAILKGTGLLQPDEKVSVNVQVLSQSDIDRARSVVAELEPLMTEDVVDQPELPALPETT